MNEPTAIRASSITRVKTRWLGGLRCRSRIERDASNDDYASIILESDSPSLADVRGTDSAASAAEHLLHALASSVTATMVEGAESIGLTIERVMAKTTGLRQVAGDDSLGDATLKSIDIEIAVTAHFRATDLESFCANDPMYKTLRRALPINISVHQTS
ncbi:MAG: OsmC family protein [Pseudomonadales bacterium]